MYFYILINACICEESYRIPEECEIHVNVKHTSICLAFKKRPRAFRFIGLFNILL